MTPKQDFYVNIYKNDLSVKLPNPLKLIDYEVAVTKVSLPATIKNFPNITFQFRIGHHEPIETRFISASQFTSFDDLVQAINEAMDFPKNIDIKFLSAQQLIKIHTIDNAMFECRPKLAELWNMRTGRIVGVGLSQKPVSEDIFNPVLFFTWDAVPIQQVNHQFMHLLYSACLYDAFVGPQYYPIIPSVVNDIKIKISNKDGVKVNFFNATIMFQLHFRTKRA